MLERLRWYKRELAAVGLLLISTAGLIALNITTFSQLTDSQSQLQNMQSQIASLQTTLRQKQAFNSKVLPLLGQTVPKSPDIPALLVSTSALAHTTGVTIQSFQLGTPSSASSGSLSSFSITIAVQGTRTHLMDFLYRLEHEARLTTVQSIALSGPGSSELSTSIVYTVYFEPR
ncbi:MAG: type 4a pilus biogenesis protein PilO [Bacilli bacterium]